MFAFLILKTPVASELCRELCRRGSLLRAARYGGQAGTRIGTTMGFDYDRDEDRDNDARVRRSSSSCSGISSALSIIVPIVVSIIVSLHLRLDHCPDRCRPLTSRSIHQQWNLSPPHPRHTAPPGSGRNGDWLSGTVQSPAVLQTQRRPTRPKRWAFVCPGTMLEHYLITTTVPWGGS